MSGPETARHLIRLVAAALVIALVGAACSSDGDGVVADSTPSEVPTREAVVPGSGEIPQAGDDTPAEFLELDASLEVLADEFVIPWAIEILGPDEFLVSERTGGLVHVVDGGRTVLAGIPRSETVFADPLILGGVNDVSLHPRFEQNGLVYLAYIDTAFRMVVGRFDFSERVVRDFEVIFESTDFSIGSRFAWPDDDHFFLTQGAAGSPFPDPGPQDLDSDSGKIHRLRADGSIPEDNPVFDGFDGPTSTWSYGHRDAQGLLFDDGVLYSNEHGPLGGDELNVIEKGGNYGWPLFSFGLNYDSTPVGDLTPEEAAEFTVLPLKGWGPDFNMAPSGLTRLRDSAFPEWDGALVWGALAQQRLIAYLPEEDRTVVLLDGIGRVRDVAQLPDGDLLILRDAVPDVRWGDVVRVSPRSAG
ncbi:MAG: PQQ-dependent sugar dehydrogenase [Actinomycetota bacterium]